MNVLNCIVLNTVDYDKGLLDWLTTICPEVYKSKGLRYSCTVYRMHAKPLYEIKPYTAGYQTIPQILK